MDDCAKILIVDDMPDKLLSIRAVLADLGELVEEATSGRDALRKLLQDDFAVILLDVNMPGMDGFETAALIRQRKRSEQTPIIFVTAYGDELTAAHGYSLGAVDYIQTPINPDVLRAKVGVFVELYKKTEAIKRQAEERIDLVREQVARAAAEQAVYRSNVLADASRLLARSLDFEATLAQVEAIFCPTVADACRIETLGETGWARMSRATACIDDFACAGWRPPLREAVSIAIQCGGTQLLWAPSEESKSEASGARALVVPLIARGHVLGTVVLFRAARAFEPADVSLAEDLASRSAMALDNARLYGAIQDAERRKDDFLAMLGHELRNPLSALVGTIELIGLHDPTTPVFGEARRVLKSQADLMKRLVDDLLDVSRITSGRIELRFDVVDAVEIVASAINAVRPLFASRGHRLHVSLPKDRLEIRADAARVEQIASNLLVNAAKYTDPGGDIRVTVRRLGGNVEISVRDTGVGIDSNLLPLLFEPFIQADRSLDRTQGGLGIGLTVVEGLVKLHGGSVTAHSQGLGMGAEFVVLLPAPTNGVKNHISADVPAPIRERSERVLLVEDQECVANVTVALLQAMGHEVRLASDGPSALAAVEHFQPEVALIDIGLPGMDGYEVAKTLRQRLGEGAPRLVALTGYGQDSDRRAALAAGFDRHLIKPVSIAMLRQAFEATTPEAP